MSNRAPTPEMVDLLIALDDSKSKRLIRHRSGESLWWVIEGASNRNRQWSPRTVDGLAKRGALEKERTARPIGPGSPAEAITYRYVGLPAPEIPEPRCAGENCILASEPGDIFCVGCRQGHDRE